MTENKPQVNKDADLISRSPVVVIMGHIDHGKSTLLDYIRHSNIVSKEAGGITQHLGAYEVTHKTNDGLKKKITFIDTPGHEAFSGVRETGAKVADVAVLIVSAEDGVKTQTIEAYNEIKKDKIPFVVAINKIDSPKANIDNTKQSLAENDIFIEGYGGDVPAVEISAKNGDNINDLLDLILLVSEVEEHKANPNVSAEGVVVEAHKDKNKGISATLIIKNGKLERGQFVACEDAYSPIRIMEDHNGKSLDNATFSTPVLISGWNKFPMVGAGFKTFDNKKEAEKYCTENALIKKSLEQKEITNTDPDTFVIPIIIKADTNGSIDAVIHELKKIKHPNSEIKVVSTGTGNVSEADVKMASGNENSIVLGFGIDIDKQAKIMLERIGAKIKISNIIYELTEWVEQETEDMRPRIETEEIRGRAKILKIFNKSKNIQIVGARVLEGTVMLKNQVKILRREEKIGTGIIKELQSQKTSVTEVIEGNEFGLGIESKIELAPGDILEDFEIVKK